MAITFPVRQALNMRNRQINNVSAPTNDSDAANMRFVLDNAGTDAATFFQTHTIGSSDTLTNFVLTLTNPDSEITFTDANTVVEHNGVALNSADFTIMTNPVRIQINGRVVVGDCITVRTAETAGTAPPPTPANTALASGTMLPTSGTQGEHFDLTEADGTDVPGIYRLTRTSPDIGWTLVASRNANALLDVLGIADDLINTTPADYNGGAAGGEDGVNAGFGGLRINPDNTGGPSGTIEVDTDNIPLDALGNVSPAWTAANVNNRAAGSILRWVNTVGQAGLTQAAHDKWGGIWAVSSSDSPFTGIIGTSVPTNLEDGGLYYKNSDSDITHMVRSEQSGQFTSNLQISNTDLQVAHVNGGGSPPATDNGFYDFQTGPSTNRVNRAADTGLGIEFNPSTTGNLNDDRYDRSELEMLFNLPAGSNFDSEGLVTTNGDRVFVRFINGTTPVGMDANNPSGRRYMLVGIGRRVNNDGQTVTNPEQGFTEWRHVDEDGNVLPSPPPLGNGVPLERSWRIQRETRPELTARTQTLSGVGPLRYTMSTNAFTVPTSVTASTPS